MYVWGVAHVAAVEISKDCSSENKQISRGYLFVACKEASQHHLSLTKAPRQTEDYESSVVEKREGFRCSLSGLLAWGSWRWANEKQVCYVIG